MINFIVGLFMFLFVSAPEPLPTSFNTPKEAVQDTIKIPIVLGKFTENGEYISTTTGVLEGRVIIVKTHIIIEVPADTIRPGFKRF